MRCNKTSVVAAVGWICLCACFSGWAVDTSSQDWQFSTADNPAAPTTANNSSGAATAAIQVGYLSAGWMADLPGFGTQTGLWDLGMQNPDDTTNDTRGTVVLSIPNPVPASGASYTDLGLRMVQFVDGFIYTGSLTFSLPGAIHTGSTVVEALTGGLPGNWMEEEYHWRLEPSPEQISLVITGAVSGTLLDRIRVDTTAVPEGSGLVITSAQPSGNSLTINWEGGLPPYEVEVMSNLASSGSWSQVGLPVSGHTAEIPMDGSVGLVRVLGSK